mmetsp:Transcript_30083/g.86621  ORF Transcript_30083/g.86621 Transcript_30083/m.86621 type:complete len:244 (+) Transcript_30083:3-734(+)
MQPELLDVRKHNYVPKAMLETSKRLHGSTPFACCTRASGDMRTPAPADPSFWSLATSWTRTVPRRSLTTASSCGQDSLSISRRGSRIAPLCSGAPKAYAFGFGSLWSSTASCTWMQTCSSSVLSNTCSGCRRACLRPQRSTARVGLMLRMCPCRTYGIPRMVRMTIWATTAVSKRARRRSTPASCSSRPRWSSWGRYSMSSRSKLGKTLAAAGWTDATLRSCHTPACAMSARTASSSLCAPRA